MTNGSVCVRNFGRTNPPEEIASKIQSLNPISPLVPYRDLCPPSANRRLRTNLHVHAHNAPICYSWLIPKRTSLGRTPMAKLTLTIDGKSRTIDIDDPDMPLLYAL